MPSYKDLIELIHQGAGADEIIRRLNVPPSRLRRMLTGRRLRAHLAIQEDLAREVVRHTTATNIQHMAAKLLELTNSDRGETSRKAILSLLSEGLRRPQEKSQAARPAAVEQPVRPLDALTPAAQHDDVSGQMPDGRQGPAGASSGARSAGSGKGPSEPARGGAERC